MAAFLARIIGFVAAVGAVLVAIFAITSGIVDLLNYFNIQPSPTTPIVITLIVPTAIPNETNAPIADLPREIISSPTPTIIANIPTATLEDIVTPSPTNVILASPSPRPTLKPAPSTTPSSPATLVANNRIVYALSQNNSTDLYTINPDGTNIVRLTENTSHNDYPMWSPDAQEIVFRSNRDGNPEIYVMNADGTNQRRLTNDPAPDYGPSWSPDGRWITFTSERSGDPEIYKMDRDGVSVTRLTFNEGYDYTPVWSPNGAHIAFASSRTGGGGPQIYVMTSQGGDQVPLTSSPQMIWALAPTWSPDGQYIAFYTNAFTEDPEIYTINVNNGSLQRIREGSYTRWSLDGRQILFRTQSSSAGLYIMDLESGGVSEVIVGEVQYFDWK